MISSAAAIAASATQLSASSPAKAALPRSFGPLQQARTSLLDVAYAETGPRNGAPVFLLHGWPYDIYSFADVAPILAARGFRVIVPFLRGYGGTRFISASTMRNGEPAALAVDLTELIGVVTRLIADRPRVAPCRPGVKFRK